MASRGPGDGAPACAAASATPRPACRQHADALTRGRQSGEHAEQLAPALEVGGEVGVARGPRGAELDLGTGALVGELAEARGDDGRRGARGRRVDGTARVQGVGEPGPGDLREEGVRADVGLERCLREADDPEGPVPGGLAGGVVQQDEPAGAELGLLAMHALAHVARQRDGERRDLGWGGDLRHDEIGAHLRARERCPGLLERLRDRVKWSGGHGLSLRGSATVPPAARRFLTAAIQCAGRRCSVPGPAPRGSALAGGVAAAGGVLAAGALVAGGVASVARRLLAAPRPRSAESRVLEVDEVGGRIRFSPTNDALMPGRYSFWFSGGRGHARVGEIVARTPAGVTRELLGVDVGRLEAGATGRFNGWVHLGPQALGVPFEDLRYQTTLGAAPAWLVPAEQDDGRWAVLVHGRSTVRQEVLRAVPALRRAGWNSLVISYRNDGEAPRSEEARYALGDTEWLDVESAVLAALDRGATEVVLVGWSLGAALVVETAMRTRIASVLTGLVLESPVIDWSDVVLHRQDVSLPDPVRRGVISLASTRLGARLAARQGPLDVRGPAVTAAADELRLPMLVLQSDDDGYAPADGPRRLARERPDLVRLVPFAIARHGRLWNYDAGRWEGAVTAWLAGDEAALAAAGALPSRGEPNPQRA